jgi:hypothetical protein
MTPNSASVAATRWVVAARKCCAENPADASFCKQCGTRLGGIAAPPTAAARSERIKIYEVTGLGLLRMRLQRGALRGYTKFVGRDREMEALRHAAEQAKAGHGQIVATMGRTGRRQIAVVLRIQGNLAERMVGA